MELTLTEVATHPSRLYDDADEVLVVCTGDWQLDPVMRGRPRNADVPRLQRMLEWGLRNDAYFIGLGDYSDAMSPSNRERWQHSNLYDSAQDAMEQAAERIQEELEEITAPTQGRWLGLVTGHHYHPYQDGSTTDSRLAAYLRAPHLGDSALVHMLLPTPGTGNKARPMVRLWAAHGNGSGQPGRALAKVANTGMQIVDNADAYVMGHFHKAEFTKVQRIGSYGGERGGQPRMMARDIAIACSGSFLRGYTEGSRRGLVPSGSYVEKGLMSPSALGAVWLSFRPRVTTHGYTRIDIDGGTI